MTFQPGDRVRVKDEHDIPPAFRNGKPTEGVVDVVWPSGTVLVNVPIGDDDPNEHSQCVAYAPGMLEAV